MPVAAQPRVKPEVRWSESSSRLELKVWQSRSIRCLAASRSDRSGMRWCVDEVVKPLVAVPASVLALVVKSVVRSNLL